jgi:hypothetical protein
MGEIKYRNRRAHILENEKLAVIVTVEGGHIAALVEKRSGVNPLWTPPWPSMEPSAWDAAVNREYGNTEESRLLAGILGHNLCLDIFGPPSEQESAAGLDVHGEASTATYAVEEVRQGLVLRATFPIAQLHFERRLELPQDADTVHIAETVSNMSASDRPIGWTQHVTLGSPFVEPGRTLFQSNATRSKVIESDFTGGKGYLQIGAEFIWPMGPGLDGRDVDMRVYSERSVSAAFTTHLMDPSNETAWFSAWHPGLRVACGYRWRRQDFPWLGIWEENRARDHAPWNGQTITRGLEFGVSPFPETRRQMIERNGLFGVPGYRWIPARQSVRVTYEAWCRPSPEAPAEG